MNYIRVFIDYPNTCGFRENNKYNLEMFQWHGIPHKNSLNTCDHVGQPFNDFHKIIELKRVLNENMD
jgi:hypothetical protein